MPRREQGRLCRYCGKPTGKAPQARQCDDCKASRWRAYMRDYQRTKRGQPAS